MFLQDTHHAMQIIMNKSENHTIHLFLILKYNILVVTKVEDHIHFVFL